jgi:hypothetical protein
MAVFTAALACRDSTGPDRQVLADATLAGIRVRNGTSVPIFLLAAEPGWFALGDWIPCRDVARCDPVPAGSARVVPWQDVTGCTPDKHEFRVVWWSADPHGPHGSLTVVR